MADWSGSPKASPSVKFEASPAESFLSMPGEMYPPLFGASSAATASTMNPMDIMTPQSFPEDKTPAELSVLTGLTAGLPETPASGSCTPAPTEKKQSKKRKSWGQVLPEPKTNLPPRKRAKTEDEKEQRRVERVLRNRRAAQSSRERKRQEVEALEQRNKQLEAQLANLAQTNMLLCEELNKMRGGSGVVARAGPVTLSQELFSSHDGHSRLRGQSRSSLDELMMTTSQPAQSTINPTSLSPALSPVPDEDEDDEEEEADDGAALLGPKVTPDLTQHPAEVLCSDLQCQSAEASRTWEASQQPLPRALSALLYCQLTLLLTSTSTMLSICRRPLTQIAMSLKAGFSLPPTPALLNTILWLVTKPSPSRTPTSTSTSSSTRNPQPHQAGTPRPNSRTSSASTPTTLRLKVLRKILTCSPMLARPLTDATMAALRLVRSEEAADVDRVNGVEDETRDGSPLAGPAETDRDSSTTSSLGAGWPQGAALPSKEVLLTLLWALKVEERRISIRKEREAIQSRPGRLSGALGTSAPPPTSLLSTISKQKYVLRVEQQQRKRGLVQGHHQNGGTRRRIG